jgi:hypothetical protein
MMVMIIMMTWQIKEEKKRVVEDLSERDENENDEDLNEYIWIGEIGWKESVCEKRRRCCGRRCLTKTCSSGLLFGRKGMNECGSSSRIKIWKEML